jgi:pyridoxine 4-dehydrogenase
MTAIDELPGGTYALGDHTVPRFGYGAMQLAGKGVFGPPADHDQALTVLRAAVDAGIRHIDTADFYGPHVTNELIREALAPYPDDLVIATKVGAVRDDQGGWPEARAPEQLREQVHANLRTLGVDVLDVVTLRWGGGPDGHSPVAGSLAESFAALAGLQQDGLINHLGVSTVDADQIAEAQAIAPVVEVQNWYNVAKRDDDDLVRALNDQGVAYVAYWPLGGFTPLQSDTLGDVARQLDATPMDVALAWLLQRSPNILPIAGTSSPAHLAANIAGAALTIPAQQLAALDAIGTEQR